MKKAKIFGKRMVILSVLIVALSAAVYLNWRYSGANGELDLTSALTGTQKYLGDAQYVNQAMTGAKLETDFFSKTRTEREATRKKSVETLKEILNDVKSGDTAKADATKQITQLTKNSESEVAIESLIKAKGFSDCVAIITDGGISVAVKTAKEGLLASETIQIQDIITSTSKISVENIKIIEVK